MFLLSVPGVYPCTPITLLDVFVKPVGTVIDYRTHVSGITPELLENGLSLDAARDAVCRIIHADTIVVGHSLNNDLAALRLRHWHVIDTAMLFAVPSMGNRTFALRVG